METRSRRLGRHLRAGRKRRYPRDSQDDFARRIGVSRHTYQKMEGGSLAVSLATYLRAAELMGLADTVIDAFSPPPPSIFERDRE